MWGLVGVEPDLDPVGVVQTYEHGSPTMAFDELVRLADLVELRAPSLHGLPTRHEQRDSVKPRPRSGPVWIVPKGDLGLAAVASEGNACDLAVLDELDLCFEAEDPAVPGSTASDVADRQLDVVDTDQHDNPRFL